MAAVHPKQLGVTSVAITVPVVVMLTVHAAVMVVGSAKVVSLPHLGALCGLSLIARFSLLTAWTVTHNRFTSAIAKHRAEGDDAEVDATVKNDSVLLVLVLGMFFFIGVPVYSALFAFAMGVL